MTVSRLPNVSSLFISALLTQALPQAPPPPARPPHLPPASRFGNDSSERPPLVLIVGFGSTTTTWPLALLEPLAEQQEVVIFDNRGQGQTVVCRSGRVGSACGRSTALRSSSSPCT